MDREHVSADGGGAAVTLAAAAPAVPAGAGILSPAYRTLTLGTVAVISLGAFEAMAVTTAMPAVAAALDGLRLYGLAFAATLAASVVGMVVAGAQADTSGAARPLRRGIAWFAVGLLVAGSAPAMWVVVAGRALQGLGSGMFAVAAYVAVGQGYPEHLRAKVFGAFAAAWVVPSLVGPSLAGALVDHVHWRAAFLTVVVLVAPATLLVRAGIAATPALSRGAGEHPPGRFGRLRWAAVAAGGAAVLHVAGGTGGAWTLIGGAAGLAGIVVAALRLLPTGTLRLRAGLPTVIALRALAAGAFAGAEMLVPLVLIDHRGLPAATAGIALTAGALGWASASWFQGRFPAPPQRYLRIGFLAVATGIATMLTTLLDLPVAVAMAAWGITGAGMGLAFPTLSVLVLGLSDDRSRGTNVSALQLADAMTGATFLAFGGTLVALWGPGPRTYAAGFVVQALLAVIAALAAGRIHPPGR